ncbi:lipocalin family protein [uncultured Phenylobacterium sp.]|uniref:lipocalin family protein n=1 Tax=uncultured Phenylobacterium sp. TaxID=349273 RepID=UPI0025EE4946|nr:lipocalin family protein [uncultured Phenylobacterium sp.]
MKVLPVAAAIGGLLLLAGCATMAKSSRVRAPEPARAVAAETFFAGRWYEIGRTPMRLTDGCVAGYTDYLRENGRLIERDACRAGSPAGKEKVVAGPLRILNPGQNNKVHVSYRLFGFIPVAREYWMLDHGEDWFVQATPDLKLINIYTREPRPTRERVAELTARVGRFGYDVTKLEFPEVFPPGVR